MLKLIVKKVKQGFEWGYSGSKILGGCKKGVTYTTPGERMGNRNLERIHAFPYILGREICDSENIFFKRACMVVCK